MARDMNDIIGKEIGRLTPFAIDDDRKNGVYYFCRCNCENQTVVRKERRSLLKGQEKDLMCLMCKTKEVAKDIEGKDFDNFKVLKFDHINKYGAIYYKCLCKLCNKEFDGERQAIRLGKTKQCPECSERLHREKFQEKLNEPIGKIFGKLKVLSLNEEKSNNKHYWYTCQCKCNNIVDVERLRLINGEATQCNECYWKERLQSQIDECIGQKFGRLTVDSFARLDETNRESEHLIMYNCSCDCKGAYKKIDETTGEEKNTGFKVVSKKDLKSGAVKSCGCLYDENLDKLHTETNVKHGMWKDPFYQCYYDMLQRCYNPNNIRYHRYGGRGITVCDEWRQPAPYGFLKFKEDMYESYNQHNIDYNYDTQLNRIDNNLGYSKHNCNWITNMQNSYNQEKSCQYYFNGYWYTAAQIQYYLAPYYSMEEILSIIQYYGLKNGDTIHPNMFMPATDTSPIKFIR